MAPKTLAGFLGFVVISGCAAEPPEGSTTTPHTAVEPLRDLAPAATSLPASSYALPFEAGTVVRVGQGYHGGFSHSGAEAYALDFPVPEGTPVVAARGGRVWSVRDDSDEGCGDPSCSGLTNSVVVDHGDGTFASYLHLSYDSAQVEVGQDVARGQPLASSGNTGFSSSPHLHFQVRDVWGDTFPTPFVELEASGGYVFPGQDFVSQNRSSPEVPTPTAWSTCAPDTFAFLGVTLDEGAPCSVGEGTDPMSGRVWVEGASVLLTVITADRIESWCSPPGDTFAFDLDWSARGLEGPAALMLGAADPETCLPYQGVSSMVAIQVVP